MSSTPPRPPLVEPDPKDYSDTPIGQATLKLDQANFELDRFLRSTEPGRGEGYQRHLDKQQQATIDVSVAKILEAEDALWLYLAKKAVQC